MIRGLLYEKFSDERTFDAILKAMVTCPKDRREEFVAIIKMKDGSYRSTLCIEGGKFTTTGIRPIAYTVDKKGIATFCMATFHTEFQVPVGTFKSSDIEWIKIPSGDDGTQPKSRAKKQQRSHK